MTPWYALVVFALSWSFSVATAKPVSLPRAVLEAIPSNIDLKKPEYRDAREELQELVANCGPGVIREANARRGGLRNDCEFEVALDEWFFRSKWEKTGLLHDPTAMQKATFFEPTAVADVPDSFDIRDLMKNGQPDLRKQNCGDCWAWSTHHGLELARAVHDQKAFDHSIQTVLSCSKQGSCGGGYMTAVDFLSHGLPYEVDFPYAGSDKSCKYNTSQVSTGWDGKVQGTPYIGSSLEHSRGRHLAGRNFRDGNKVKNMMAAIYQWSSPLVVTVDAYSISGPGIYSSCSAINSGGNHMVAITGWDTQNGKRVAHVWNSWGKSHGENGVSRIQWECGDGKLNRGLGVSAKIVQYKAPCTPPNASQVSMQEMIPTGSVQIGATQAPGTTCKWTPTNGLTDPTSCVTTAKPTMTTEYHLSAENGCGKSSSMTLVHVWNVQRGAKEKVLTPFGVTNL